jgi:hypothetical protein
MGRGQGEAGGAGGGISGGSARGLHSPKVNSSHPHTRGDEVGCVLLFSLKGKVLQNSKEPLYKYGICEISMQGYKIFYFKILKNSP